MTRDTMYICDMCGEEFHLHDEAEEHLAYNHDIFDRFITVDDPRDVEPEPEFGVLD